MDAQGNTYRTLDEMGRDGQLLYEQIPNLSEHLQQAITEKGPEILKLPLRIDADRKTPFQKAIDALDTCKLAGFTNVGLKTRMRAE